MDCTRGVPAHHRHVRVRVFPTWVANRNGKLAGRIEGATTEGRLRALLRPDAGIGGIRREPQAVRVSPAGGLSPDQQATPLPEVRRVLALLAPEPHETLVDFGCGPDARWLVEAAATYGCRGVGVEIDPVAVAAARSRVAAAGLESRVEIVEGDAASVLTDADVGVAYLWEDQLERIRPQVLRLERFASMFHAVPGLRMEQDGDAYLWRKATEGVDYDSAARLPARVHVTGRGNASPPRLAKWGNSYYSGRVCGNPRCRMCREIERQLSR